jgi:hypothetical protein
VRVARQAYWSSPNPERVRSRGGVALVAKPLARYGAMGARFARGFAVGHSMIRSKVGLRRQPDFGGPPMTDEMMNLRALLTPTCCAR